MKVRMFSKVLLSNGRTAYIVEIFKDGEAFLVDIDLDEREISTEEIYPDDIKEVLQY